MNNIPNQNRKVLGETLAGSNLNAVKTTLRDLIVSKWPFPFCKVLKNLSPFLSYFVTHDKDYYISIISPLVLYFHDPTKR